MNKDFSLVLDYRTIRCHFSWKKVRQWTLVKKQGVWQSESVWAQGHILPHLTSRRKCMTKIPYFSLSFSIATNSSLLLLAWQLLLPPPTQPLLATIEFNITVYTHPAHLPVNATSSFENIFSLYCLATWMLLERASQSSNLGDSQWRMVRTCSLDLKVWGCGAWNVRSIRRLARESRIRLSWGERNRSLFESIVGSS